MRSSLLALVCLLVASAASGQTSTVYTRQRRGDTVSHTQVSCGLASTTLRATNVGTYDRLSILIKNCENTGGNTVWVCPGTATCTTAIGFQLQPREGFWLDWTNDGIITCIATVGAVNVCNIEERN